MNIKKARAFQRFLVEKAKDNNSLILERTSVEEDAEKIINAIGREI